MLVYTHCFFYAMQLYILSHPSWIPRLYALKSLSICGYHTHKDAPLVPRSSVILAVCFSAPWFSNSLEQTLLATSLPRQ